MAYTTKQLIGALLTVDGRANEGGIVDIPAGARLLLDVIVDGSEPGQLFESIAAEVETAAASATAAAAAAELAQAIAGATDADDLITALDAFAGSTFRVQQDTRHDAAYATKATQTTVDTGRLSSATQLATFVPRSLEPIKLDASHSTTATLDALIAGLTAGAVLEIPPNVTINRAVPLTLPVPITIKGDGTLHDTRTSPTTPFISIPLAAAGSKIECRITGAVTPGTYVADHHAISIVGTDNGAGVAPTFHTGTVVKSPEISGFGSLAIYAEFLEQCQLDIDRAYNLGYGGVIARSVRSTTSYIRRLYNITPGTVGGETYGIQFDRRDATSDLVRYPHSQDFHGRIDVARNCTAMNMLGTHGGQGGHLSWGAAYGIKRPIDIVGATGAAGPAYAANNVSFHGGYANSGVSNGTGEPAAAIAGAYSGAAVVEHAKAISGHIGVLVGYGSQGDATSGAVYAHSTQGLNVSIGTARDCSPWVVNIYHNNKNFVVSLGTVMDSWTTTQLVAGAVNVSSTLNTGWILAASGTRGPKSATIVNNRGLSVTNDASNIIRLGVGADFSAFSTPTAGPLTSPFMSPVQLPASTVGEAYLRLPHGTAPATPANGDVWTTTAGLFVRINGTTVGPLT